MAVIFPVFKDTSARWDMQVELDQKSYKIHVSWNSREDSWYLDLMDESDTLLAGGIKLVPGVSLIPHTWAYPYLPQGDLFIYDAVAGNHAGRVDWESFGVRYYLAYEAVS